LAKTNREQSLIVHALFGKWNLPCWLAQARNDSPPPPARRGKAWAAASSRTAMAGDSRGALPIQTDLNEPHRTALRRCDRDHIRIEELRVLVFNNAIAGFA
jgi:hypothetical protein